MTNENSNLFSRQDTFFGICEAVGQDFGFNPLWLRLALGAAFVLQPVGVVVSYLALGLVVLVSRLAFPSSAKPKQQQVALPQAPDRAAAEDGEMEYAKAA